jgi:hypothetical protein
MTDQTSETDAAYRAIGGYVVAFSYLVRNMREAVEERLSPDFDDDDALPKIALAGTEASAITRAFFGMCRRVGQLDDDEQRVEKMLRSEVVKIIEQRNDIAHGDWFLDLTDLETGKLRDPVIQRIHALRAEGHEEELTFSVESLDAAAAYIRDLTVLVVDFGRIALGLPVLVKEGKQHEVRVRDVWTVTGSKKKPTVTRDGLRADEVPLNRPA